MTGLIFVAKDALTSHFLCCLTPRRC